MSFVFPYFRHFMLLIVKYYYLPLQRFLDSFESYFAISTRSLRLFCQNFFSLTVQFSYFRSSVFARFFSIHNFLPLLPLFLTSLLPQRYLHILPSYRRPFLPSHKFSLSYSSIPPTPQKTYVLPFSSAFVSFRLSVFSQFQFIYSFCLLFLLI